MCLQFSSVPRRKYRSHPTTGRPLASSHARKHTIPLHSTINIPLDTSPLLSPGSPRRHTATRTLGVLSVVSLIFFNVSGGPLGSEGIVSAAGPVVGLSAMVAFVLLFSVPQAMITAELSTAFPDNGGYSLWVKAAFGDF